MPDRTCARCGRPAPGENLAGEPLCTFHWLREGGPRIEAERRRAELELPPPVVELEPELVLPSAERTTEPPPAPPKPKPPKLPPPAPKKKERR